MNLIKLLYQIYLVFYMISERRFNKVILVFIAFVFLVAFNCRAYGSVCDKEQLLTAVKTMATWGVEDAYFSENVRTKYGSVILGYHDDVVLRDPDLNDILLLIEECDTVGDENDPFRKRG